MAKRRQFTAEDLSDTCTVCGKLVHPSQIMRLDSERSRCPHCGGVYTYPPNGWRQLGGIARDE